MHCSPEEVARGANGSCLSALAVFIVLVACQQKDVLQGSLGQRKQGRVGLGIHGVGLGC